MRSCTSVPPRTILLLALLCLAVPGLASAQDAVLEAELTYLGPGPSGSSIYRYDYSLTNVAVEPFIIELFVFFDSDPDSGVLFLGDITDFDEPGLGFSGSTGAPAGWVADVWEDPDPAPWVVDFFNPAGDARVFPGETLDGFSVTFLWKGSGTPGVQYFEALDGYAHEGTTIVITTSQPVTGTVTSDCEGAPLAGVSVDLFNAFGDLVASTLTGPDGSFEFLDLPPGDYTVSIATPIGYEEPGDIDVVAGMPVAIDLLCLETENDPRTIGFWKHQVNVHLTGRGKAQVPYASFLAQLDVIYEHFALNAAHPVEVYTVPPAASDAEKLEAAQEILTVNKKGSLNLRARQQLMALLLNVASLKLGQFSTVSMDGATASQAITYAWDLIADGDAANDELAKDIADTINNGMMVPAGWIPLTTPNIAYERPDIGIGIEEVPSRIALLQNAPNPVRAAGTEIRFRLAEGGRVTLEVFDVQGSRVRTLLDALTPAGENAVRWDGRDDRGGKVPAGLYFYRLEGGGEVQVRKLIMAS